MVAIYKQISCIPLDNSITHPNPDTENKELNQNKEERDGHKSTCTTYKYS